MGGAAAPDAEAAAVVFTPRGWAKAARASTPR